VRYAAIKGNREKLRGINSWGEMTRKGFKTKPISPVAEGSP